MDGRYSKQKMVLGTHTSEGEQNYLMLAEVGQRPLPPLQHSGTCVAACLIAQMERES